MTKNISAGMGWRALAALLIAATVLSSADAAKFYRDVETGQIYGSPGENREEYKPFGLDLGFQFFLQFQHELENRNQPAGVAYADKLTNTEPYSAFTSTRGIVDIGKKFSDRFRTRLVLDHRGAATDYRMYVRHVYGEYDFPSLSSTLSFGEIGTPIIPYDDAFWGYRVQGTSFTEREGLFTSGDWGLGWKTKFQSLPLEWNTTFTNAEGRTTAEVNSGKAVESRLIWNIKQIEGLNLSAAGYYSTGGSSANTGNVNGGAKLKSQRYVGNVQLKRPFWRLAGTYVWSQDEANSAANARLMLSDNVANQNRRSTPGGLVGTGIKSAGFSVMGVKDFAGTPYSIFGRWETFDPADEARDNSHDRWIAGAAWQVNDWMKVLLNYENLEFEDGAKRASGNNTANAFDQSRILLQSEIKF